jgi:uncharacterized protein (DUF362 family)
VNRRSLLSGAAIAATTAVVARHFRGQQVPTRRRETSRVAVLRCNRYDLAHRTVDEGLRQIEPDVRGKRILLKPNLVEYSPSTCINTHPTIVASAVDALYRLGAASIVVADGPGHIRDVDLLLEESGLRDALKAVGRAPFVDLNFDTVTRTPVSTRLTSLDELWLPQTVRAVDVIISMPKIKTHHWAGVTLSLKNLFGVVPGSIYGWPKNILHWQGIDNSIVELAASVPIHYVIADGVDAMEGNGPLHGPSRHLGCLVFADDPVAADATCCQLMGIDPRQVKHLALAAPLGNVDPVAIQHRGELLEALIQDFALMQEFEHLRPPQ